MAGSGAQKRLDRCANQSVYAPTATGVVPGPQRRQTMTTKNDDGLRARMATLLKTPVPVLRKRLAATGQDPAGMSRDALVKALAGAENAPTKAAPPRSEKALRVKTTRTRDARLPAPGGVLQRVFKKKSIRVEVTDEGLRYEGKNWSSLTALALHITGYKAISGPAFFGLTKPPKPETPAPEPIAPAKKKAGRPIAPRRSK